MLSLWKGIMAPPIKDPIASEIIYEVARRHNIGPRDITVYSKHGASVRARKEAMWRLRQLRNEAGKHVYSYPKIARLVGLKDHTSAIHAERTFVLEVAE